MQIRQKKSMGNENENEKRKILSILKIILYIKNEIYIIQII